MRNSTFDLRRARNLTAARLARLAGFLPTHPDPQHLLDRVAKAIPYVPDDAVRGDLAMAYRAAAADRSATWVPSAQAASDDRQPDDSGNPQVQHRRRLAGQIAQRLHPGGGLPAEEPDEDGFLSSSLDELNARWLAAAIPWRNGPDADEAPVGEPGGAEEQERPSHSLLAAELQRIGGPAFAGAFAAANQLPDEMLYELVRETYNPRDLGGQFFITSSIAEREDEEPVLAALRKVKGALLIAAIDHHFLVGGISDAWRGIDAAGLADVDWVPVLAFVLALPVEEQRNSVSQLYGFDDSPGIDTVPRLAALRLLLPHLSDDQVGMAFADLVRLDDPTVRRIALELIAPRLDTAQVSQALPALNTSADVRERAWCLNELARALDTADARGPQIAEWSLDAATAIRSGKDFGLVASFVARHLIDRTDDAAAPRRSADENDRFPSAAMLPADRMLATLRAMDYNNRVDAIGALALATSGPLPVSVVNEALNLPVVNPIDKFSPRGWLISTLAERFPEESLAATFRAAMELPHRTQVGDSQAWGWNWSHEYPRGSALYSLASRLRGEMAEAAFSASGELPWVAREEVLQKLAAHADERLARALFDYSFKIHETYMNLPSSAQIPYALEHTVVTQPLSTFKIDREVHLAEMIAATASRLDPVRVDRAVAQAQAFNNAGPRSWLPSRLLPPLSQDRREPLLSSAFVATLEFIGVDPSRLDLLTDLLPFIRQEIDRRRDAVRDFVEHLVPGQRELLTLEQFSGLPEAEQLEFRSLMGLGQVEEMAAVPEEASDDVPAAVPHPCNAVTGLRRKHAGLAHPDIERRATRRTPRRAGEHETDPRA